MEEGQGEKPAAEETSGQDAANGKKKPTTKDPVTYRYIGPAAGAKGKSLSYQGQQTINPSKMTDAKIAALEKSNPDLFNRLWVRNT